MPAFVMGLHKRLAKFCICRMQLNQIPIVPLVKIVSRHDQLEACNVLPIGAQPLPNTGQGILDSRERGTRQLRLRDLSIE